MVAKSSGAFPPRATLVTSIPPSGLVDGRQWPLLSDTIASFEANGFDVISVNRSSEIDRLRSHFADVRFVTADSAGDFFPGRYGPSIGSVLAAGANNDTCAIINADIYMLKSDIVDVVGRHPKTFFVARRIDVDRIGGNIVGVYRRGIDAVLFNVDQYSALAADSDLGRFQLGAPFWDIVIPVVASFHGTVAFVDPPFILHTVHRAHWSHDDYDKLREAAIKTVIRHAETCSAHSSRASIFLQLMEKHVGTNPDILNRRAVRNAMTIFDLWIRKIEVTNAQAIRAEIDGVLDSRSLQRLSDKVETPTDPFHVTTESAARTPPLQALNRLAKAALREWKRTRREKGISTLLKDIDF